MRTMLTLTLALGAVPVAAQDAEVPAVVRRAVTERARRDAGLGAWRATAEGLVRFASVVRHGGVPMERVIRADELQVEVYGDAPSRSKQVIHAWRDSSFLPNAIVYHRDHLGIVANDFGEALRLGEGDEVADVPHPLTPRGLAHYRFTLEDTVTLRTPRGAVRVVQVGIVPRDPAAPGALGRLALDLDRAAVVRFVFTFTPASYRDPTVRDITVTLENALLEDTEWLPWRQAIAIRRATPWFDLPLETVLRADWRIDGYAFGVTHPPGRFTGRLVDGLRAPGGPAVWQGPLVDRLAAEPATTAALEALREEATTALAGRLRSGLPSRRLVLDGVSGALRVNRVQGVALGGGLRLGESGRGGVADLGVGTSDDAMTGGLLGELGSWQLRVERRVEDVVDIPFVSGVARSLAAITSGRDYGDWVRVDRAALSWARGAGSVTLARERRRDAETHFTALDGSRPAAPPRGGPSAWRLAGALGGTRRDGGWSVATEIGHGDATWGRVDARYAEMLGPIRLETTGGLATRALPVWGAFALGGRGSLPGAPHRELVGRRAILARVGVPVPVALPTPPIPFVRHVALPSRLMPFVAAGAVAGRMVGWEDHRQGSRVVGGVRLDLWGLVRLEVAVGGGIGLTLDAHPDWWPVL